MKQITDVKEIHSILLQIAKEFHNICVKHDIPYYMLGGTMLGTVRHSGFIPWDDDMDFGVPRKYIKKLLEVLRNELPAHLSVITPLDGYGVVNEIIKITDNRTIVEEHGKEHIIKKMGLFIDIFPLDRSNNNWSFVSRNILVWSMICANNLRCYPSDKVSHKLLKVIIKLIPQDIYFNIIRLLLPNNGLYLSNYSGAWGKKETIPMCVFGEPALCQFEDSLFYGVSDSHQYLKALYGDYLRLPSEQERHLHLDNVYWA